MEKDEKLNDRTVISVQNILELLGFCLHNTYSSFQNKFYEQVEGVPMGLPVSPIVATLYMECFERKALRSTINLPWAWFRFVDDTWVIQKQAHKQEFVEHLNKVDPAIKFIVEENKENGAIPFLDTLVTPLADNSLSFKVYQKPTHHHSLSFQYSVIGTLTHRAKVVCTDPESLQREFKHLRSALGKCNYPTCAIKWVQQKVLQNNWEDTSTNNPTNNNNTSTNNNGSNNINNQDSNPTIHVPRSTTTTGQIVIPYTKGISKSIKQPCGKYGIQVHFKGNQTIKQILMKPKDKDPKDSKSGVIYSYQCPHLDCNEEYIGETSRTLGERRKKHLKQSSPIHGHAQITGHSIENNNFNIIGREDWGQARTIKESIYIRVNNPP